MSCEEIKKLLDEYITGELEESVQEKVKAHIEGCPECKREYEELKSLKAELKSLSEEIPQGFDERLKEKIRKEKKTAFWRGNHFGAGMAAAVVLVCIIGLGYGIGQGTMVEDKINSVKNSGAQSAEIIEPEEEADEESAPMEENAVTAEKSREENNAEILTEATTIYIEEINTELVTETYGKMDNVGKTETERPSEKSVAETKAEKIITETDNAPVAEIKNEIAVEITTSKPNAVAGRQSLQEAIPKTEADNKDESLNDMGIDSAAIHKSFSSDSVAAAGAAPAAALTEEDAQCDEATFTVKAESLDKVYNLLEEREEISDIEKKEGRIYARVNNLPYGALKTMLSECGAEEKDRALEETCTSYNVVIEAE